MGARDAKAKEGLVLANKYRLAHKLGAGGFSEVYQAEHISLGKTVAIKLLSQGGDPLRFRSEARSIARLHHPNVVHVMDFGELEDGMPFFVMEYLDGITLEDLLRAQFPLKLSFIRATCEQLCHALAFIHAQDCIHRDLKPSNIMVSQKSDGSMRIKLFDFGIAKNKAEDDEDLVNLTMPGLTFGTPYYMSPEQILGDANLDHRTDVYTFGVILYELFAGKPPFHAKARVDLMEMHLKMTPPVLEEERCSDSLRSLLGKLMAKRRKERPSDMLAVWAELEQALAECKTFEELSSFSLFRGLPPTKPEGQHAQSESNLIMWQPSFSEVANRLPPPDAASLYDTSQSPAANDTTGPITEEVQTVVERPPAYDTPSSTEWDAHKTRPSVDDTIPTSDSFIPDLQKALFSQQKRAPATTLPDPAATKEGTQPGARTQQPRIAQEAYTQGLFYGQRGEFMAARTAFCEAIAAQPSHAPAHYNLGLALANLGEFTKATDAFRGAIAYGLHDPRPYYNLALALDKLNRLHEAEEALKAALEISPHDPSLLTELGRLLHRQARHQEAIETLQVALSYQPYDPRASQHLADALLHLQRLPEAEQALREAITYTPHDPRLYYSLANILQAQGRRKDAQAAYHTAEGLHRP